MLNRGSGAAKRGIILPALLLFLLSGLLSSPATAVDAGSTPPRASAQEEAGKQRASCEEAGLEYLAEADACSHGPDPAPSGVDPTRTVRPVSRQAYTGPEALRTQLSTVEPRFECEGDGTSGYRTEVLYVRASDRPDRFEQYRESFVQWAFEADGIYRTSAAATGGDRRIRYVTDQTCAPKVSTAVLSPEGDDSLGNTIIELQQLGFDRQDRVYLLFVDASVYCGVATARSDDRPGQGNRNNSGQSYARVDAFCWSGHIAAHEHMHTLGGVQFSAPNSSKGFHCVDEWDLMCYSDEPQFPQTRIDCPDASFDRLFDCNQDDYFSTDPPPGSYLADHWNTADSQFLVGGGAGLPCSDKANEPADDTFAGAQQVTFGAWTSNAFCRVGDADWIMVPAVANQTYQLEFADLTGGAQVVAGVYGPNGKFRPNGFYDFVWFLGTTLQFTARTGGNHYIRVGDNYSSGEGDIERTYKVRVVERPVRGRVAGGWGYNGVSQLGSAFPSPPGMPALPPEPFPGWNPIDASAGILHSLAVSPEGYVLSVGWNGTGQLGDGTTTDRSWMVGVPGFSGVTSVSAGFLHSLALKKDGTVWAWGSNVFNQLGDGTSVDRRLPVKVKGLTDVVQVSAGWYHNLALKRDGSVWAWGWNGFGNIGDGTLQTRAVPVKVDVPKSVWVSAGLGHSLASGAGGQARAWGLNSTGQLGDGTRIDRATPVPVLGPQNLYQVAAGALHSIALDNNSRVWGWGNNAFGQAGGSTPEDRLEPEPVLCVAPSVECAWSSEPEERLGEVMWVSAGGFHNLAINVMQPGGGRVWSWGWNGLGQGTQGMPADWSPTAVPGRTQLFHVSAGYLHNLLLQGGQRDTFLAD